jgi:hypothetical protein
MNAKPNMDVRRWTIGPLNPFIFAIARLSLNHKRRSRAFDSLRRSIGFNKKGRFAPLFVEPDGRRASLSSLH